MRHKKCVAKSRRVKVYMKKLHKIAKAIYLHKIMIACGAVAVYAGAGGGSVAAISFKHFNEGEYRNIFFLSCVCVCVLCVPLFKPIVISYLSECSHLEGHK